MGREKRLIMPLSVGIFRQAFESRRKRNSRFVFLPKSIACGIG
jgi:hypothetical protein